MMDEISRVAHDLSLENDGLKKRVTVLEHALKSFAIEETTRVIALKCLMDTGRPASDFYRLERLLTRCVPLLPSDFDINEVGVAVLDAEARRRFESVTREAIDLIFPK